ncbi:MAG: MBL fold metallo-hydrolase [Proteobacteria bacterium]|nr:MBL fold metallo-hydrolase [Pseudomonadota bacterium]
MARKKTDKENRARTVRAMFLGTNSLAVTDGATHLLIDPYFTRPGKLALGFRRLRSDPARVREGLARAGVNQAAAILVTHAHVDHALDLAEAARQTGALMCGSSSAVLAATGYGLPGDRTRTVGPGESMAFGDFTVTFLPARHLVLPFPLPPLLLNRDIRAPLRQPARTWAFKEGQSYHLHVSHPAGSFVNQGTAGHEPGALEGYQAGVLLLGIGGMDTQPPGYMASWYEQSVNPTGAKRVLLTHWDDFSRPLSSPPRFLRGCEGVARDLAALDPERNPVLMPWMEWVELF